MLCFICLTENREEPNKAVTYVQGMSVCREHAATVSSALSALYKIREATERIKEHKQGQIAVDAFLAGNGSMNGKGESHDVI